MGKLSDILNSVRAEPDFDRARQLASNDYQLIADLVRTRKDSGMSQVEVAELLGVTQQAVSKIESYDGDPQLSTLRKYANAIGAIVRHEVRRDIAMSSVVECAIPSARATLDNPRTLHIITADDRIRQASRRTASPTRGMIRPVARRA